MAWNPLCEFTLSDDRRCQYWICRCDTSPNTQCFDLQTISPIQKTVNEISGLWKYKVEGGDEPVNEGTANEPAIRHHRYKQKDQTPPMPPHVRFRQLNADGKDLDDEDNAGEFECDLVGVAPCKRIEQVECNRAEYDAYYRCDGCGSPLAAKRHHEGRKRGRGEGMYLLRRCRAVP